MCGIWFFMGDTKEMGPNVDAAIETLKARGPETKNVVFLDSVILGFTRLAINGTTSIGDQPVSTPSGRWWVICNGEIYNYHALAKEHSIELPEGVSDCYILPYLFERYTANQVCRMLDGVFAIVAYDRFENKVIIARDPYGVRPLFMGRTMFGTVIASELKALPLCTAYDVFPPGHSLQIEINNHNFDSPCIPYHSVPWIKNTFMEDEAARANVRGLLYQAVEKRLLSDRPIGALLSGGLDSSLIAAIATDALRKRGATNPLETFSIGMPGSTDLRHAQIVADHIGSKHHEIVMSPEQFLAAVPEVVKAIESYDITTVRASVGNYLVAKYIRENTDIKVVFNGDGADELLGGYLYFYKAPNDTEFETEIDRLLREIYRYDVLRSDRCISSNGLEPRTPFLDRQFVAYCRSIPTPLLRPCKTRAEKQLLRDAFRTEKEDGKQWLPIAVLDRRKEAFSDGVSSAETSWFSILQEAAVAATSSLRLEDWADKINPPKTREALWYRNLFEQYYGESDSAAQLIPQMWMPRWSPETTDPSARTLKLYSDDAK